jgi:hypothetical protein
MSLVHWVGKTFHSRDDVDPIIVRKPGEERAVSPTMGKATLRMVEFRGTSTATMTYDKHPILDHFRKIADDLVMGVMDRKGDEHRCSSISAAARSHPQLRYWSSKLSHAGSPWNACQSRSARTWRASIVDLRRQASKLSSACVREPRNASTQA